MKTDLQNLYIAPGNSTQGVFARRKFIKGDAIADFHGKTYFFGHDDMVSIKAPEEDRFLQIGPNEYIGASGEVDDYFNHSCEPNAGLIFKNGSITLTAIKDILPDQEITFDYSTTMDEDDWEMDCACGSKNCRKRIRDFKYLPEETRKKYAALGIVPEYNLKYV